MSQPLHIPKTKNQYTDPAELELYDYFVKIGWNEQISDRHAFEFLIEARDFAKGKTILDAGAGDKRYERFLVMQITCPSSTLPA